MNKLKHAMAAVVTNFTGSNSGVQTATLNVAGHLHIHQQIKNVPDTDIASDCLRSLHFSGMYKKPDEQERVPGSGDWIFTHEQYQSWREKGGVLAITGRVGCGKSSLLQYVVAHEDRLARGSKAAKNVVLWFGFRYDGDAQYRSELGMLRSLLWQMLKDDSAGLAAFVRASDYLGRCRPQGQPGKDWDWDVSQLRTQFGRVLAAAWKQRHHVCFFLDGLGECGGVAARKLINYFWSISEESKKTVKVCFSSRPSCEMKHDFHIELERENGQDVRLYVESRFQIKKLELWDDEDDVGAFKDELCLRTANCFQWLCWVCPQLVQLAEDGESYDSIVEAMEGFPEELGEVYAQQLTRIPQRDVTYALRLFQWLSLNAACLLTEHELRHAACLEDGRAYGSVEDAIDDSVHWCDDLDIFGARIARWSRKLITRVSRPPPRAGNFFMFDHHSVQEFMVKSGLQILHQRLHPSAQQVSLLAMRLSLARKCLAYFNCKEVIAFCSERTLIRNYIGYGLYHIPDKPESRMAGPAFALAAGKQFIGQVTQMDADITEGPEMWEMLEHIEPTVWMRIRALRSILLEQTCAANYKESTLLHFLVHFRLYHTLARILRTNTSSRTPEPDWRLQAIRKICMDQLGLSDAEGQTPLSLAASLKCNRAVKLLIDRGARPNVPDHVGRAPLHHAAMVGADAVLRTLLKCNGVDVDMKDLTGGTALSLAISTDVLENRMTTVRLLLPKSKLGVHSRHYNHFDIPRDMSGIVNGRAMNLHAFIELTKATHNLTIRECCLVHRLKYDTEFFSAFFGWLTGLNTPLMRAAMFGSLELLALLLDSDGMDGSLKGVRGMSILHCLSLRSPQLLQRICDGDSTHLQYTFRADHVRLIIGSGKLAVDIKDSAGSSPLNTACTLMDVVKALLSTGEVDVLSKDQAGCTPFENATLYGHTDVVQLLIEAGLAVDCRGSTGRTLLALACLQGHDDIMKLLLHTSQVDINSLDDDEQKQLQHAVTGGYMSVVELLSGAGVLRSVPESIMKAIALGNFDMVRVLLPATNQASQGAGLRGHLVTLQRLVKPCNAGLPPHMRGLHPRISPRAFAFVCAEHGVELCDSSEQIAASRQIERYIERYLQVVLAVTEEVLLTGLSTACPHLAELLTRKART
ncbi:hypothetical protein LTR56_015873 [Elasticomyces elasticus]|nr:hypothetical protein LTR56_015873 [Elasticomyces elasticus]KAK3640035.1 hypothetical protein LTR22_017193 [Elasticomyces elasticus]KAK4908225.1 hypothetical protein LTR49_022870 [Elasticomyces elasticus]KAK5754990.1 hypothetical protein LTS12_014906 [Elasticomyces elasticus]